VWSYAHTRSRARAHTHTHTHMRMSTIGGKKNNAVTHTHRRSVSDAHVQELLADGKEAANDARARIALFPMSSKVKMTHHLGLSLSLSLSLSVCVCMCLSQHLHRILGLIFHVEQSVCRAKSK